MNADHIIRNNSRREFLQRSGVGFGTLALQWMVQQEAQGAASRLANHVSQAKSVIWLFMEGGPSHLDLVDPKPLLNQLAGLCRAALRSH